MNKKGKNLNIWIVIGIVAVIIAAYFLITSQAKTVQEHSVPADISKSEKGTGLQLKFYDANGNPIEIPSWFSTASIIEPFAIVSHPPAPACTVRTQCADYATNPNIICWTGKCVLGNIASMDMGVQVTNPGTSQLAFLNIAPTTAAPSAFNTNLNKTVVAKLSPGGTASWGTLSSISVASFIGTNQTFSVSVQGTNEYTGALNTVSDSLVLNFAADPTGSLTVSVVSPI